jgi:hypothetical protein
LASARDRAFQPAALSAQPAVGTEWLREAKFGMFIHRGLFPSSAGF